uniref:Uncharacterized protein n=3 Tax=Schistocephalus solidus TaxID=70667 RepID=A0A0V0J8W8_SCHSO
MQKPYEDKRQDVREYSNSHFSSLPKPQWFTEGPSNADEQIELDDLKMPSHRLSNIGDKCEENISVFPGTSKSETEDHKDVCIQNNTEAGSATAGNVIPSEPLNNKSKNIQKPSEKTKIYTLREIELELRVRSANYESDNDMTGYYKLLEMVGITFDRSVSPILVQTQANLLKGVHSSDPLTNEKIEKLTHNGAPVASRSRVEDDAKIKVSEDSPLIPALDEKVPSHVPQHVFPPENLGNNAFRWIRAITNAASANAFISQNMESSCNLESDLSVQTDNDVEPLYQAPHCNAFPGHGHENEDAKFIGHNTENSFSCQALPFQVNMNFPTNAGYNRLYDRFFPSLAFPNPNKLLSRPHFQPFIMQKLLQQQNLAKFGYLADSALNLLQWRNLQNIMTGYATMPEFQQFSNSHCTAYGPANGAAMCANPQDYRQQIQQEEGQQSFSG